MTGPQPAGESDRDRIRRGAQEQAQLDFWCGDGTQLFPGRDQAPRREPRTARQQSRSRTAR